MTHELLQVINDADKLYDVGLKRNFETGTFQCPVCSKSYVKEHAALKHLEERNCLDMSVLFSGTTTELMAYETFVSLTNEVNPGARVSITIFRNSPTYNNIMKFMVFLMLNKTMHLKDLYLAWIIETKSTKFTNQTLKYAMEMKNLEAFRLDVHRFDLLSYDDMTVVFNQEKENIKESPQLLVRLVETCKLTIGFIKNHDDPAIQEAVDNLPVDYMNRLLSIINAIA